VSDLPETERRNPESTHLDALDTSAVLRLMNEADRTVPGAVERALPQIARAVELLVGSWRRGGRWVYVGAGTSGRLAALDAAELPPTFGVDPERVVALLAGGEQALLHPIEGAEDDVEAAGRDLDEIGLSRRDVVVGVAASGSTPYTVAAVRRAAEAGCATVGISCVPGSELGRAADVGIEVVTGPEILTGSTRLKAGTAQKMVLNMLSTASFVRLGRVYENLMVDVQATNEKLRRRARRIVGEAAGVSDEEAGRLLREADGSAKLAVVMALCDVGREEAAALLRESGGMVRRAVERHRTS